jgi:hypothetical protein
MKRLINPLLLFLALSACKEKEVPVKTKGTTNVKGRYTIVNTDIPVPDIDVYLSNGGFPTPRVLVNETVTDSNGNFEMTINDKFDYGEFYDNYNHTGYLASRQKGGQSNNLTFDNDGKTHIQDFEMIPPAWVNVTIRNKSGRKDFEIGYVSTQRERNWITFGRDELTSSKTLKIFGNMPDSLSVSLEKIVNGKDSVVERITHMFYVPGLMVKDTIIDF